MTIRGPLIGTVSPAGGGLAAVAAAAPDGSTVVGKVATATPAVGAAGSGASPENEGTTVRLICITEVSEDEIHWREVKRERRNVKASSLTMGLFTFGTSPGTVDDVEYPHVRYRQEFAT